MKQALPSFLVELVDITELAANLYEVTLTSPNEFNWQAGDYLWAGIDEQDLRPFSIANLAHHADNLLVLQIAINDKMIDWWQIVNKSNQWLIKGPVSQYQWPSGQQAVVMLAGGTGITPLLSLLSLQQAMLTRRSVTLYWGVRHPELAFAQLILDQLAHEYALFKWQLVVSEDINDEWSGLTGDLPSVIAAESHSFDMQQTQWLICGPWPMAQAIKTWLDSQQVDKQQIQ